MKEYIHYGNSSFDRDMLMDQINRFCDMYGVPHICTDKEDRVIRGNFCAAVTSELFMAGTGRATEEIRNGQALFYNESADMDSVVERVGNGEKIDTGREICRRS